MIAIEGNNKIEQLQIILFAKANIGIQEVNTYLKENGFLNFVKLINSLE